MTTWTACLDGGGRGYARQECSDWHMAANWLRGMLDAAMPETDPRKPSLTYEAAVRELRTAAPGEPVRLLAGRFVLTIVLRIGA